MTGIVDAVTRFERATLAYETSEVTGLLNTALGLRYRRPSSVGRYLDTSLSARPLYPAAQGLVTFASPVARPAGVDPAGIRFGDGAATTSSGIRDSGLRAHVPQTGCPVVAHRSGLVSFDLTAPHILCAAISMSSGVGRSPALPEEVSGWGVA